MAAPLLSIVIPMHNESESMDLLFSRLIPCLEAITPSWEIVCVDDGSRDSTALDLEAYHRREARIKLVQLSRNFGKEIALTAGIDAATGQAVIPMDADLQVEYNDVETIRQQLATKEERYFELSAYINLYNNDNEKLNEDAKRFEQKIG